MKVVISIQNYWKTIENHISASNVKFHPKGAISQRPKESASHHYQNLFENQWIFGIPIIFWMNFSMQRTNLQIFQKWHFFAIWSPDAPWSVRSLSANENSIIFDQKIGRSNLERLLSGFFIKLIISRPNVWKTASKYISASNGKFHPKGATSQRPKESASHHLL